MVVLWSWEENKSDLWGLKRNSYRFLLLKPDRVCGRSRPGPFRRVSRFSPTLLLPRHLPLPDTRGDAGVRVSGGSLVQIPRRLLSARRLTVFHPLPLPLPPARRCHPGFVGVRCEHADLLAVVATNRRQTVTTALVLCVIGCVLVMVLCTLLQWVPPYPTPFLRSSVLVSPPPPSPLCSCWWTQECRRRRHEQHYCLQKHGVSFHPSESGTVSALSSFHIPGSSFPFIVVFLFCLSSGLRGRVAVFSSSRPGSKRSGGCQKRQRRVLSGAGPSAQLGLVHLMNLNHKHYPLFFTEWDCWPAAAWGRLTLDSTCCWTSCSEEESDSAWKKWRRPGRESQRMLNRTAFIQVRIFQSLFLSFNTFMHFLSHRQFFLYN